MRNLFVIKRNVVELNRIEELNFMFDEFDAKTSGIACVEWKINQLQDLTAIKAPTRRSQKLRTKTMETVDALLEEYKLSKTGNLKALRDTISGKIDLNSSIGNQVEDEEIEKEKEKS